MLQNKEINTSDDFFTAIDNGYQIYVSTAGKLVAYSSALSHDSVKESISVNPIFIRDSFNTFFETTLHDLLHTQYADALRSFFHKYLDTNTHFTLEAGNALKKELRSLITSIKTEQIKKIYKLLPENNFSLNDTEVFFKEVSKIPYYTLLRISGSLELKKDFQQYLPPVGKITVTECIKVIEYFAQSFQNPDVVESVSKAVQVAQHKWSTEQYKGSVQKKNQENEAEINSIKKTQAIAYTTPEYSTLTEVQTTGVTKAQVAEEQEKQRLPQTTYEVPHEYHNVESQHNPGYAEEYIELPHQEAEPHAEIAHQEEKESNIDEHQFHEEIALQEQLPPEEYEEIYHQESMEGSFGEEHNDIENVESEEIAEDISLVEHIEYPEITESLRIAPEEHLISDEGNDKEEHVESMEEAGLSIGKVLDYEEELELPYEEHHEEAVENAFPYEVPYSDVVDEQEDITQHQLYNEGNVIFSYEEFRAHLEALLRIVIDHSIDFGELNSLPSTELKILLAFLAQYHGYDISRQQSKFQLIQHATMLCTQYNQEKESIGFPALIALLTLALQSREEVAAHNIDKFNYAFAELLHILLANEAVVVQYQALNIEEYERVLVYASLLHHIVADMNIEQFLLYANTISAIGIVKEIHSGVYSPYFFHAIAKTDFDDLQYLEEYYSAYYYQMILFQYANDFKQHMPQEEYNSHVLFTMIATVERIHSYVFTDEKEIEHSGKGILSLAIEAHSIYLEDTTRSFLEIFKDIAQRSA